MQTALVTGASRGFGLATARALTARGFGLVVDGRDPDDLAAAQASLGPDAVAVPGDVADDDHRRRLAYAVAATGRLDLLVHNASTLGGPLGPLATIDPAALARTYAVNVVAPVALTGLLLPLLRRSGGVVVHLSSDAAVAAYPGWGGYGSSKAALDQVSAVLAVEEPALAVYALDPGDMRTRMHQEAFPGEDISDRPPPEAVVPALLRLLDERPPGGRYRAADLLAGAVA
ncbi:MAG: SDR family NAD(P)-dependent oxidoreductase [Actinomycetota bacterium]|nr:SDR family NAD(P)-dependent oxidoreductase [Actinomycetota bacterium]